MPFVILPTNSASGGYDITNSLRFNAGSSDYLNRTPAGAGSLTNWTWSGWIKRSTIGAEQSIFFGDSSTTNYGGILFQSSDTLDFVNRPSGGVNARLLTTQVFRDVSAWYHIVVVWNTSSATSGDRLILYVNGVRVTSFSTETYPSQNTSSVLNTAIAHEVGAYIQANGGSFGAGFRGYMSDVFFIDGQALTPSSFGETDSDTGIWKPKAFSGTYGTNGFYLQFKNSASLGTDSSGNGNTFTVNNLTSVDQSTDTPTNNFCTMNPLDFGDNATSYATFSEGNLKALGNTSAWRGSHGTMGVSIGKWYFEGKAIGVPDGDTGVYIGWCDPALATTYDVGGNNANYNFYIWTNQAIRFNNSITGSYYSFTQDDICGFALDLDNGKGYISKNGTFYNNNNTSSSPNTSNPDFTITLPPTNNGVLVPCIIGYNDGGFFLNFGSPPYSANSYTDGAGYGNFSYAVPSGYYSLNTKNLANFG